MTLKDTRNRGWFKVIIAKKQNPKPAPLNQQKAPKPNQQTKPPIQDIVFPLCPPSKKTQTKTPIQHKSKS